MKKFIITKNDSGQRLNKFLEKAVPKLPSSLMHKYIRLKRIKLNGKRTELAYKLIEGDVLELYINDELFEKPNDDTDFLKISADLNIIYEDDNIILVDKKSGIACHSDDNNDKSTLITHIKAHLYKSGAWNARDEASFTPALCNRIDRNTGGIVIGAKTAEALRIMNDKIKNHELEKRYLCLVHGVLPQKSGKFDGFILKHDNENRVSVHKTQVRGAKSALTYYKVLEQREKTALVECTLVTGRTHQIRAHFGNAGFPLVGDTKYGTAKQNQGFPYKYQCLYSYKLQFNFSSPSGILEYLNKQEFTIKNIPFLK